MAIRFSDLIHDQDFAIKNRRTLKRFYENIRQATKEGALNLEGHSLPTTMNSWIASLPGGVKPLTNDHDVVDFSLAEDDALARWKASYLETRAVTRATNRTVYLSSSSRALLEAIKTLDEARAASMTTNAKKEDLVSALSDFQAAASEVVMAWDSARSTLKLPDRRIDLERVKTKKN